MSQTPSSGAFIRTAVLLSHLRAGLQVAIAFERRTPSDNPNDHTDHYMAGLAVSQSPSGGASF
jgi:hypothetical protein